MGSKSTKYLSFVPNFSCNVLKYYIYQNEEISSKIKKIEFTTNKNTYFKFRKITESSEFWFLMDQLVEEKSSFLGIKETLLDGFKDQQMYGLEIVQNTNCSYVLPCFCVIENLKILDIIWVSKKIRNKGFGKTMVELSKIKKIRFPLEESVGFWKKLGFEDSGICMMSKK